MDRVHISECLDRMQKRNAMKKQAALRATSIGSCADPGRCARPELDTSPFSAGSKALALAVAPPLGKAKGNQLAEQVRKHMNPETWRTAVVLRDYDNVKNSVTHLLKMFEQTVGKQLKLYDVIKANGKKPRLEAADMDPEFLKRNPEMTPPVRASMNDLDYDTVRGWIECAMSLRLRTATPIGLPAVFAFADYAQRREGRRAEKEDIAAAGASEEVLQGVRPPHMTPDELREEYVNTATRVRERFHTISEALDRIHHEVGPWDGGGKGKRWDSVMEFRRWEDLWTRYATGAVFTRQGESYAEKTVAGPLLPRQLGFDVDPPDAVDAVLPQDDAEVKQLRADMVARRLRLAKELRTELTITESPLYRRILKTGINIHLPAPESGHKPMPVVLPTHGTGWEDLVQGCAPGSAEAMERVRLMTALKTKTMGERLLFLANLLISPFFRRSKLHIHRRDERGMTDSGYYSVYRKRFAACARGASGDEQEKMQREALEEIERFADALADSGSSGGKSSGKSSSGKSSGKKKARAAKKSRAAAAKAVQSTGNESNQAQPKQLLLRGDEPEFLGSPSTPIEQFLQVTVPPVSDLVGAPEASVPQVHEVIFGLDLDGDRRRTPGYDHSEMTERPIGTDGEGRAVTKMHGTLPDGTAASAELWESGEGFWSLDAGEDAGKPVTEKQLAWLHRAERRAERWEETLERFLKIYELFWERAEDPTDDGLDSPPSTRDELESIIEDRLSQSRSEWSRASSN